VGSRKFETTPIPHELTGAYNALCRDLLDIKRDNVKVLTLSKEAHELSTQFANALEPKLKGDLEHIADWAGKHHGAVLRIAGILHVVEELSADGTPWEDNPPVSADTMKRAISVGDFFLEHAKACYGLMGTDKDAGDARYILRQLESKKPAGELIPNDIWRICRGRFEKTSDIKPGLEVLKDYGYLRYIPGAGIFEGGRPKGDRYILNPKYFA